MKWKKPRMLSLVVMTDEVITRNKENGTDKHFGKDEVFIWFGEIPNMEGHCVVFGHTTGKMYSGFHCENFKEYSEESYEYGYPQSKK